MAENGAGYCTQDDVEQIYGAANVAKWADLDNLGNVVTIAARIAAAIAWACNEIDSRFRKFIYDLPLANAEGDTPLEVTNIAATLVGVWLYENRGIQDFNPDTGASVHKLEWNRRRAERTMREILSSTRTLDAVTRAGTTPAGQDD